MIDIRQDDRGVLLAIKVIPHASRDRLMGEWDGRLKIAVAAPAEKGRANEAVCAFLAKLLSIRKQAVTIERGDTTPLKLIRIEGTTVSNCRAALASIPES